MSQEGKKVGRRNKTTLYQKATHFELGSDPRKWANNYCHETHKITLSNIVNLFSWKCAVSFILFQRQIHTFCIVHKSLVCKSINVHLIFFTPAWSQRWVTVSQHGTKAKLPSLLLPLVPLVVWIAASPMCSGQATTMPRPCPPGTTFSPYNNRTTAHPARCRPRLESPLPPRRDTPTSSQGETTSTSLSPLLVNIYSHVAEPCSRLLSPEVQQNRLLSPHLCINSMFIHLFARLLSPNYSQFPPLLFLNYRDIAE